MNQANESIQGTKPMQHVFVYGTLRAGESNDIHHAASRNGITEPVLIGSGHINGRLYDFGTYPGVVPDANAAPVHGDVYRIEDTLVPVLDEIEEVVPGISGLFRGEHMHVTVELDGRAEKIECLVYPVSGESVQGLPQIGNGDWVLYRYRQSR
jgi:gamma-glutamylcyclotransferase (GGCT)/AIG2-like uncharacterized protein YtfP